MHRKKSTVTGRTRAKAAVTMVVFSTRNAIKELKVFGCGPYLLNKWKKQTQDNYSILWRIKKKEISLLSICVGGKLFGFFAGHVIVVWNILSGNLLAGVFASALPVFHPFKISAALCGITCRVFEKVHCLFIILAVFFNNKALSIEMKHLRSSHWGMFLSMWNTFLLPIPTAMRRLYWMIFPLKYNKAKRL